MIMDDVGLWLMSGFIKRTRKSSDDPQKKRNEDEKKKTVHY